MTGLEETNVGGLSKWAGLPVESKVIGRVSEVTHITRVRRGVVPMGVQLSYATRLKVLLNILGRVRDFRYFKSPLHRFRSLRYIRWVLIDDDSRLLFSSEFDHSWEKYVQQLVDIGPSLVDLVWSHTENYEPGLALDFDRLAAWVREHQIETNAFFAANPNSTVRDIQQFERLKDDVDDFLVSVGSRAEDDRDPVAALANLRAKIGVFHEQRYRIGATVKADYLPKSSFSLEAEREYTQIEQAFGSLRLYFAPSEQTLFERAFKEFLGADWFEHKQRKASASAGERAAPNRAASAPPSQQPSSSELSQQTLRDIQGSALRPYAKLDYGQLLFFRLDEAAAGAEFLSALTDLVTTAEAEPTGHAINVTLTCSGFTALGFGPDALLALPDEFRAGMASRAAMLGDGADNAPECWSPPRRRGSDHERIALEAVDVVVFVQAEGIAERELATALVARCSERAGIAQLGWELTQRRRDTEGHEIEPFFGFRDGLSQPSVAGLSAPPGPGEPKQEALGEFVLGHEKADGKRAALPRMDELGLRELYQNGSFVALRKLSKRRQEASPSSAELEQFFGRTARGVPLANPDSVNAFDYAKDAGGGRCPFSAHVRRANPRFPSPVLEGKVPRIVRRIMPYRAGEGGELDGMYFLAFNANLSLQYELLQAWLNGANINDGFSSEADPVASTNGKSNVFTYATPSGELRTVKVPPITLLEWGMYLFLPSKTALQRLASHARAAAAHRHTAQFAEGLAVGDVPRSCPVAHGGAKLFADGPQLERFITEQPTAGQLGAALWDQVEAKGGVVDSAYGVLISRPDLVRDILERDGEVFSVAEYGRRMSVALGEAAYLGQDYGRDRPESARLVMELLDRPETLERAQQTARARARAYAEKRLKVALESGQAPSINPPSLLQAVLPAVVGEFLGLEWSEATARWLTPAAIDVAGYLFNPHFGALQCPHLAGTASQSPDAKALEDNAQRSGSFLNALCSRANLGAAPEGTARQVLEGHANDALFATVALGATAPTAGTFNNLMRGWLSGTEFARVRSRVSQIRANTLEISQPLLRRELLRSMQKNPLPGVVYRKCLKPVTLGGVEIAAGAFVVLRLSSAAALHDEGSWGLVFGHGVHACPGAEFGLQLIQGIAHVLLELPNARPWPGRMSIRFDAVA